MVKCYKQRQNYETFVKFLVNPLTKFMANFIMINGAVRLDR